MYTIVEEIMSQRLWEDVVTAGFESKDALAASHVFSINRVAKRPPSKDDACLTKCIGLIPF